MYLCSWHGLSSCCLIWDFWKRFRPATPRWLGLTLLPATWSIALWIAISIHTNERQRFPNENADLAEVSLRSNSRLGAYRYPGYSGDMIVPWLVIFWACITVTSCKRSIFLLGKNFLTVLKRMHQRSCLHYWSYQLAEISLTSTRPHFRHPVSRRRPRRRHSTQGSQRCQTQAPHSSLLRTTPEPLRQRLTCSDLVKLSADEARACKCDASVALCRHKLG